MRRNDNLVSDSAQLLILIVLMMLCLTLANAR